MRSSIIHRLFADGRTPNTYCTHSHVLCRPPADTVQQTSKCRQCYFMHSHQHQHHRRRRRHSRSPLQDVAAARHGVGLVTEKST